MPSEMHDIGMNLSIALSRYVSGSLSYFNNRSNVDINARLVCFDLKDMDANQRDLTMLIIPGCHMEPCHGQPEQG